MPLQDCTIYTDQDRREVRPHGTIEFPCAGYDSVYSVDSVSRIPWHWHEELEVIYLYSGTLEIRVPGRSLRMNAGDSLMINSNILHEAETSGTCRLQSLVFHPDFICSSESSVFYIKYIQPLISSCAIDCLQFSSVGDTVPEPTQCFLKAFQAFSEGLWGHEFTVREHLSRLCFLLYRSHESVISETTARQDQDSCRIKTMIHMIEERFAEPLKLYDIAKSANIGERECLRCFRRTLGIPPMQYLIRYRLSKGALLLTKTSQSISEISIRCGFDSPSNFSRMFKRTYQCSPREYRNRNKEQSRQAHLISPTPHSLRGLTTLSTKCDLT